MKNSHLSNNTPAVTDVEAKIAAGILTQKFREARAQRLREGLPLRAIPLMKNLKNYSQKGDAYIATLREVIEQNNLTTLNQTKSEKPT